MPYKQCADTPRCVCPCDDCSEGSINHPIVNEADIEPAVFQEWERMSQTMLTTPLWADRYKAAAEAGAFILKAQQDVLEAKAAGTWSPPTERRYSLTAPLAVYDGKFFFNDCHHHMHGYTRMRQSRPPASWGKLAETWPGTWVEQVCCPGGGITPHDDPKYKEWHDRFEATWEPGIVVLGPTEEEVDLFFSRVNADAV